MGNGGDAWPARLAVAGVFLVVALVSGCVTVLGIYHDDVPPALATIAGAAGSAISAIVGFVFGRAAASSPSTAPKD